MIGEGGIVDLRGMGLKKGAPKRLEAFLISSL